MEIAVIGISQKEASVHIRGQVAFTTLMKEEAARYLDEAGILECMIISTCNRSEVYIATKNMLRDIEIVKQYYAKIAGQSILPYIFIKKYAVALQHIYQVATGLNSLIIGEDQILGQMKEALNYGIESGSSKKYICKVVREAITFSKKIRTAYKLSENRLSVASIGVKYLKGMYTDLKDKKIMLIGTGAMGQLILKYLEAEEVKSIYLTNRTFNRENMTIYIGPKVKLIEYVDRYKELHKMDIVISATASPHIILKANKLENMSKPITFLDMAVPRDVDENIDELSYATVITLDDFNQIAEEHLRKRHDVANQINRLIKEEVKELELWILRSKVDGVIKKLHKKQASAVDEALNQAKDTIELSTKEAEAMEGILNRAIKSMFSEPIKQLKALEEVEDIDRYKMVIEKLFDFESGEE